MSTKLGKRRRSLGGKSLPTPEVKSKQAKFDSVFISSLSNPVPNSKKKFPEGSKDMDERKKNRMGQRARKRMWEEKYGDSAKHVQAEKKAKGKDGKGRYTKARGVDNPKSTHNKLRKEESSSSLSLHPSWEASKRMKEKHVSFQGQRTVFSDSD